MLWRLARHVRDNLVGYIALFVALGGTAFAATSLPPNSVGTVQLKNGAVTGMKVAHQTLTAANIKLSTLGFGNPASFTPGTADASSTCVVGEIKLYAGQPPAGVILAHGQKLSITSNAALFTVLGTAYGGNGKTNFAVPDLRGVEPKGNSPHGVNYYICTSGLYP